jgi:PmbA protein
VKDKILAALKELRQYALDKGYDVSLVYHEEDNYLMRFANSAISLNTNEHIIRLGITAYDGRKRASNQLITDLEKMDEIKQGIDIAAEMVIHSQPLTYDPTVPTFSETFIDDSNFDEALAKISNEERLAFVNKVVEGLETDELKLSGIFANGTNILAMTNTRSEHILYFQTSDAQVEVVMAHAIEKWETTAAQSAQKKSDLDPTPMRQKLVFLIDRYNQDKGIQLELGEYDVVFGPEAISGLLRYMNFIGYNGGLMKRGYSFLKEEQVGQKVLSDKITLIDDPTRRESFPFKFDFTGIKRARYPLFEEGVFKGFIWNQDEADEFSAEATGHTVPHISLSLKPGTVDVRTLEELAALPRDRDTLFIPTLHYTNIVNPSAGIITGTSRFGAMLLKKDGTVQMLYNVRLTQSLLDIFGEKVAWLSKHTLPYNVSMSYGARNPIAIIVPYFMQINGLEISHANTSF